MLSTQSGYSLIQFLIGIKRWHLEQAESSFFMEGCDLLSDLSVGERLKKPVPLQEQTVKDAKGRYQRFHGAFTGGFSAGYFNTVGTKEG